MSSGEYRPWNLLPRSLRIQNIAVSAISLAVTPRWGSRGQWLFVLQAHLLPEPFRALPSHLWLMFAQTLAQEGWLLILRKKATLMWESGDVKERLYELLKLSVSYLPESSIVLALCVAVEFLAGAYLVFMGIGNLVSPSEGLDWRLVAISAFGLLLATDSLLFYRRDFKQVAGKKKGV